MKPSQILIAVTAGTPLTRLAAGQSTGDQQPQVSVYNDSTNKYHYYGCYNETTEVEGSAGSRALNGGTTLVKPGEMTVPMCLTFCASGDVKYRYAGLEWARLVHILSLPHSVFKYSQNIYIEHHDKIQGGLKRM